MSGHVPTPGASAYAMSKAAVHALAGSLRAETLTDGVGVVLVSPGFVESEIRRVDNRGVHHPDARDTIPPWLVVPADRAARVIVRAVARRRREVIITEHGKVVVWLARHLPSVLAFALERGGTAPAGSRQAGSLSRSAGTAPWPVVSRPQVTIPVSGVVALPISADSWTVSRSTIP